MVKKKDVFFDDWGKVISESVKKLETENIEIKDTLQSGHTIGNLEQENQKLREENQWLYGKLNQIGLIVEQGREESKKKFQ